MYEIKLSIIYLYLSLLFFPVPGQQFAKLIREGIQKNVNNCDLWLVVFRGAWHHKTACQPLKCQRFSVNWRQTPGSGCHTWRIRNVRHYAHLHGDNH